MFSIFIGNIPYKNELSLEARIKVVDITVQKLRKEVSLKSEVSVDFGPYFPACATGDVIKFDPLFFVSLEELPADLQPGGPNDPRLDDRQYVQRVFDFVWRTLGVKSKPVSLVHMFKLRAILRMLEDKRSVKDMRDFMILHEMGHIHHKHTWESRRTKMIVRSLLIGWMVIGLLAGVAGAVLSFTLPIILLIASLSILPFGIHKIASIAHLRYREFQADRFAAAHMQSSGNGCGYLLDCMSQGQEDLRRSGNVTFYEKIFTIFAEVEDLISHGSTAARVARCSPAHMFSLLRAF